MVTINGYDPIVTIVLQAVKPQNIVTVECQNGVKIMDVINNRFAVLLAEKQIKERRNIPLAEIADEVGIARKTLYAWENNTVTRFDVSVIDALCKYFQVKPGDLFEYVEGPPTNKKKSNSSPIK